MATLLFSVYLLLQGIPVQQGGRVSGVLRDSQGMPLAGVRMAAVARGATLDEIVVGGAAMAGLTETDAQGRFSLEDIPPGRYSIAAGRLDLQTYFPGTQSLAEATVLTVRAGETTTGINFALNNASMGRSLNSPIVVIRPPQIQATIPVRVRVENGGKLPISSAGRMINLRLDSLLSPMSIPVEGTSFTVSGPGPADFRLVVENLPESYEVKAIEYGSTVAPKGVFRLTAENFPRLSTSTAPVPTPAPTPPTNPVATAELALRASLNALASLSASFSSPGFTLTPATSPPSMLSITIGEAKRAPATGVRVTGTLASRDKHAIYISGKPGVVFSDGSFEFRGVEPGRHVIAALGVRERAAAVLIVGDKDLDNVPLQEVLLLPDDVRQPKPPLPAGDLAPGTVLSFARIKGRVVEAESGVPVAEGQVILRTGDYSRPFPIDAAGRFETSTLLPGTYDLKLDIFGHSTIGPTIVVEDKDVHVTVNPRRLY